MSTTITTAQRIIRVPCTHLWEDAMQDRSVGQTARFSSRARVSEVTLLAAGLRERVPGLDGLRAVSIATCSS
jgi:hypothetical protein